MVLNRNHAFFFCDLVSLIFLMVSVVSRIFLAGKIETLGGFMKPDKKINWNLSGAALGPRAQRGAWEVSIFFLSGFMNTTQGFQFILPKYPWIPLKPSKNQWNPGHKIKKICVVYIEIPLWWYFGQKYSFNYQSVNLFQIRIKLLMYLII